MALEYLVTTFLIFFCFFRFFRFFCFSFFPIILYTFRLNENSTIFKYLNFLGKFFLFKVNSIVFFIILFLSSPIPNNE